jgi:hypothetical protein
VSDIEAFSRLSSVLDVLTHEGGALRDLNDERLNAVLIAMTSLQGQIELALADLRPDDTNGRH